MPIQLHIQKMKREADVIKKNEKSANEYLTQTAAFNTIDKIMTLWYDMKNGGRVFLF